MATELFIHKMTEHMDRARIIKWLAHEGDAVAAGQVVMEVETEKAVVELEAPASGILRAVRAFAVDGAEVPVGETLALIAAPDEEVADGIQPSAGSGSAATTAAAAPHPASAGNGKEKTAAAASKIVRATPVARRMAKDLGVDLRLVTGSGPNDVIRHHDVRAFADALTATTFNPLPAKPGHPASQLPNSSIPQLLELTSFQHVTGRRMLESVQTAPQFALDIRVDMSAMLAVREAQAESGEKPSVTACLVRAAAAALKRHPRLNSSFEDDRLLLHTQINIGVAVGTRDGLIVPVVRDAGGLSLAEIAACIREYQRKTENMRFAPEDLSGGTFTISNLGMFSVDRFNAILNPPQSAILAVGRTVKTAIVFPDDTVGVRPMATLTLTVDHRAVDGMQAALFLDELCRLIENPYLLI